MTVCEWRAAATNEQIPAETVAKATAVWTDVVLPVPFAVYETGCRDANGNPHRVVGPTPNAMKPGACPICLNPRRVQVFRGSQP